VFLDTKDQNENTAVINLEPYTVHGEDSFEPDNSANTGHAIQPGEYQARSLNPYNDIDYAKFYATQGLAYYVDTYTPSNDDLATTVTIYDSTGTQIKSVTGEYYGTTLNWTATYTGTCYIRVTRYSYSDSSYTLALYEYMPGAAQLNPVKKLNEWRSR
jgi:hypothetical protein